MGDDNEGISVVGVLLLGGAFLFLRMDLKGGDATLFTAESDAMVVVCCGDRLPRFCCCRFICELLGVRMSMLSSVVRDVLREEDDATAFASEACIISDVMDPVLLDNCGITGFWVCGSVVVLLWFSNGCTVMLPMADVMNGCCKACAGVNRVLGSNTKMCFKKSYKFSLSVIST